MYFFKNSHYFPTACGTPPTIENGHVANAETNIVREDTVRYECDSGYFSDQASSLQTLCELGGNYTSITKELAASCAKC